MPAQVIHQAARHQDGTGHRQNRENSTNVSHSANLLPLRIKKNVASRLAWRVGQPCLVCAEARRKRNGGLSLGCGAQNRVVSGVGRRGMTASNRGCPDPASHEETGSGRLALAAPEGDASSGRVPTAAVTNGNLAAVQVIRSCAAVSRANLSGVHVVNERAEGSSRVGRDDPGTRSVAPLLTLGTDQALNDEQLSVRREALSREAHGLVIAQARLRVDEEVARHVVRALHGRRGCGCGEGDRCHSLVGARDVGHRDDAVGQVTRRRAAGASVAGRANLTRGHDEIGRRQATGAVDRGRCRARGVAAGLVGGGGVALDDVDLVTGDEPAAYYHDHIVVVETSTWSDRDRRARGARCVVS